MCGVSTEFSHLTAENLEMCLASDDVLVHFFNDFLSLPSFTEALYYNQESGLFEFVSAHEFLSSRSGLHCRNLLTSTTPVDNQYSVCQLDREQGIQWIVKERLPFFLQSDCYVEYRLAKLMLQWNSNSCIQKRRSISGQTTLLASQLLCSSQFKKQKNTTKVVTCRHSLDNITSEQEQNSHKKNVQESSNHNAETPELQLQYLATRLIINVLKNALSEMDGQNQGNVCDCHSKSRQQTNCINKEKSCECKFCQPSVDGGRDTFKGKTGNLQEDENRNEVEVIGTERDKKNRAAGSWVSAQENVPDSSCCGPGWHDHTPGLDKFKRFLQGTPGEKLINLWMDIEKLKLAQHRERKNRHLVLMRSRYLLSSSHSSLNAELLSRLGLSTPPCWTEEKLHSVQPCLTEALLRYWAPRFWMSGCDQDDDGETPGVSLGTEWCYSPLTVKKSNRGSLTLRPLRPDTCLPQSSHCVYTRESRDIEQMLQALRFEPCAGLYFTHFCEQSGNQLWENAVYFWTDLQQYHELFYQDGMDPYRVQREAQVLYFTYLYGSARRAIGLDEKIRGEVHDRLMPAFEELFDTVEEHTLNILLQPWTLLVSRDKESFLKVCVRTEVRRVDGQARRKLQNENNESDRWKQEERSGSIPVLSSNTPSTSFVKPPTLPESWSGVSPDYQGYRLGSLLRHPHEIGHFMSFLQNQDASIHLTCWLDLEQYRRTPQKDKALRQERSSHMTMRYLNRNYFFGPHSPASADQQNDILRLAGGLERLKLDCVSNAVVAEIQDVVRNHIEKIWLPQFLSTPEFEARQKDKPKLRAADGLSQPCRRRPRKEAWKAKGLWMSSSKEILLFRRILLNPVTCIQFQHFVSLKGDFLENDVLFWLEVQRYKDLCHSHSDEATIQQKISTIISCFISSSMPPALQIDIPPGQAQHILEKRHELGPYVFREAQMSVFSELLKFWPEFQELSSSVQEEQLLPLLEQKRVKHRARVRRQKRREEEEDERIRTQEGLEAEEYSFRRDEETDDDVDNDEEVQEDGSEKKLWTQSGALTQPLSWSYSKYMAALKREEVLLRRHSQLEGSFSTASESSSSICSIKSVDSKHSRRQSSRRCSGANGKRGEVNSALSEHKRGSHEPQQT